MAIEVTEVEKAIEGEKAGVVVVVVVIVVVMMVAVVTSSLPALRQFGSWILALWHSCLHSGSPLFSSLSISVNFIIL
jgi:uncharacterized membrane protein YdbT with pleckstrin-like domain